MIVFDGYLTGNARKYFVNKYLNNMSKILVLLFLITIPIWLFLSLETNTVVYVMPAILGYTLLSPIIFRICVSKKERQRNTIKKVIIKNGEIKAVSDKSRINSDISKVKKVCDYGEYYDIVFPAIYFTSIYVCQKDLLSKGSIEEFENIFSGKIVRMTDSSSKSLEK